MISLDITAKDVLTVTGYNRHELRGLLQQLEFEGCGQSGKARIFTRQELIVLAICCELEARCSIGRKMIRKVLDPLRDVLSRPREIADESVRLFITFDPPGVDYIDSQDPRRLVDVFGLVLPLRDLFSRVDAHLNPQRAESAQRVLPMRPVVAVGRKKP